VGLTGCAEIKPPTTQLAGVGPQAGPAAAGDPSLAPDGAASQAAVPAFADANGVVDADPVAWQDAGDDEEPADGEELEDDHEDLSESPDISACLDRGPSSPPHCPQFQVSSPLAGLGESEIQRRVKSDMASLGSISIGAPNRGRLLNGIRFPDGSHWKLTDPGNAYGTRETVDSIVRAIDKVQQKFPDSPPVIVGHLSAKNGGRLRPHKSHQAGRDVDLSYFYTTDKGWYAVANQNNLDRARTWAFVKAFVEDPNVEMILVDTSIQRLLREYALAHGEPAELVDRVFQVSGKNPRAIVRHVQGHATHIHVRFFSPSAQATAHLAAAYLPKPPTLPSKHETRQGKQLAKEGRSTKQTNDDYFMHRCHSGDTLDSLSRRYGVSVQSIKEANGLRSNALKEKRTYLIPKPKKAATASASSAPAKTRKR
jgi:penicillin-insensitive murein endopeptidase